jgi:hypothetical protein
MQSKTQQHSINNYNRSNERIRQHINHIINFKPYLKYYNKEVPKHFRKNTHYILSKISKYVYLSPISFL